MFLATDNVRQLVQTAIQTRIVDLVPGIGFLGQQQKRPVADHIGHEQCGKVQPLFVGELFEPFSKFFFAIPEQIESGLFDLRDGKTNSKLGKLLAILSYHFGRRAVAKRRADLKEFLSVEFEVHFAQFLEPF